MNPYFHTDIYKPVNPHKYIGKNIDHIVYRSGWEKRVFEFCDNNTKVLGWASEPVQINYLKPDPNSPGGVKKSVYYPDLYVEYIDNNKKFVKEMIEMKPEKFTKPSRAKNPKQKLFENYQYSVNMRKWKAAQEWCKANNIGFRILTEKFIFRQKINK